MNAIKNDSNVVLVSVIVPIYNAAKYLDKCVSSIINQSYKNIEILLVDDGSMDESEEIIRRYCEKYKSIRGFFQENKGPNGARLKGVEEAEGDFVMFVDADDWIEDTLVEKLIENQVQTGADLLISGIIYDYPTYTRVDCGNVKEGLYTEEKLEKFYSEFIFSIEGNEGIKRGLVAKLIEKKLALNVLKTIPEIYVGEDQVGTFACCIKSKGIYVGNWAGYHYVKRDDSQTSSTQMDFLTQLNKAYTYLLECIYDYPCYAVIKESIDTWLVRMMLNGCPRYMKLDVNVPKFIINYKQDVLEGSKVVLYGAGKAGAQLHKQLVKDSYADLMLWIDKDYPKYVDMGLDVSPITAIKNTEYDKILIAVKNRKLAEEIKQSLMYEFDILETKILIPEIVDYISLIT